MSRAAVICEFNPFHNGHKFLLEKIKTNFADETVCIMSGNFVQRGDIAITDKYKRAKAALLNGADLVVELPTVYAVSSARIFAENGVRLAASLNCDTLCFGSENDVETLIQLAEYLEDDEVNEKIQQLMKSGEYYPKALSIAVGEKYAEIISKPNNILAVEYIKACKKYGIKPVSIERKGAEHDDTKLYGNIASASKIREMIINNQPYSALTPMNIDSPITLDKLEPAIIYKLKTSKPETLSELAEISEGLENRIIEAGKQYNTVTEILNAVKTKRYTLSRLRRIMIYILLDITKALQNTPVPYIRVLGIKSGKESLLKDAKLPLIIKTKADYDKLDNSAKAIFSLDLKVAEALNTVKDGKPINEFLQGLIKL